MTQHEWYESGADESGAVPDLTQTHEMINGRLIERVSPQPRRRLGKAALTLALAGGMLYGGGQLGANAAHLTHDHLPWVSDAVGFFQQLTGNK